jgi:Sulfotransferase domain
LDMTVPAADREPIPSLLLAGVGKCGTTSLFWYLSQHPAICPSAVKETRYFLPMSEVDEAASGVLPQHDYHDLHFPARRDQSYLMDGTPHYFHGGSRLVDSVRLSLTDPRVIVLLREPVSRVWSVYRFARSMLYIPKSLGFAEYVDMAIQAHTDRVLRPAGNRAMWSVAGSMYGAYLPAWLDAFGDDRIKLLFFEDLVRSPRTVVGEVCDWLGIDSGPAASTITYETQNRSVSYRSRRVQRVALALNGERVLRNHRRLKAPLRSLYHRLNGADDDLKMDAGAADRLDQVFREPNANLAALLRQRGYDNLPAWLSRNGTSTPSHLRVV